MNERLKSQLRELAKKFDLYLFVLFGSRATNQNNKNSDWDFAFYSKNDLTYKKRKELLLNLI